MSKRNHNVQTPGEVPKTPQDDDSSAAGATQAGDDQTPAAAPEPAEPAAAEPVPKDDQPKAAPRSKAPKTRADYTTTPAADIDPAAITAPVLSRDGWVIPLPKA